MPWSVVRCDTLRRCLQRGWRLLRRAVPFIIAEQNVNWALRLADRGIALELGRVRLAGRADELKGDEHVRHAYLGI